MALQQHLGELQLLVHSRLVGRDHQWRMDQRGTIRLDEGNVDGRALLYCRNWKIDP